MEISKRKISASFTLEIILLFFCQICLLWIMTGKRQLSISEKYLFAGLFTIFSCVILYIIVRPKIYYDELNLYAKYKGKQTKIPLANIQSITESSLSPMRWYDLYTIEFTIEDKIHSARVFTSEIKSPIKKFIECVRRNNPAIKIN